jgi:hypothetical protein
VRIVHPERPKPWGVMGLLVAAVIWWVVQLSLVEAATTSGWERPGTPRKAPEHTYAWPKNGLDEALSAQTCSLSENSAEFCLLTITGAFQLA